MGWDGDGHVYYFTVHARVPGPDVGVGRDGKERSNEGVR